MRDFTVLNAIVDVRQNPVFDMAVHGLTAMHQGHVRAVAPQVQGRDRRRILAPITSTFCSK